MRDSGLDVSYALRQAAIDEQRQSFKNAKNNGFNVGSYEQLIPTADLVINLTPDKQHTSVVNAVMPLMKQGAALGYSHGFNIVEEGMQIRKDITVVMVAPNVRVRKFVKSISAVSAFLLLSRYTLKTIHKVKVGKLLKRGLRQRVAIVRAV